MIEAEQVLQRLRGREDVTGELALLVEGLGVGAEASIEEYIIDSQETAAGKDEKRLYGPGEGLSWVAKPPGMESRHESIPHVDPLVTLFGSVHETGSMRSLIFSNMGSTSNVVGEHHGKNEEQWDVESQRDGDQMQSYTSDANSDDNLTTPLLSLQTTDMDKDMAPAAASHGSYFSTNAGEAVSHADIGGGWQLVWKWSEKVLGEDGKKEGGFQRIYLHQEAAIGSRHASLPGGAMPEEGEFFQAAALVSQPALSSMALVSRYSIGPAMDHPPETVAKGTSNWSYLLEPGVKRALFVGVGLQMLQQVKSWYMSQW